jgi:large subunit ribosomal protein L21
MYAVVRTGGKQYRVAKDDVIVVEKLAGEPGAELELDQVLMLDDGKETQIGAPLVEGARVAATVIDQARGDKIIVFKRKRRKDYRRTRGHRQSITVLRINEILGKGEKRSAAKAKTPAKQEEPAPETEPAAAKPAADSKPKAEPKVEAKKPAAKKPAAKKPAAKKAAAKNPAAKKAAAKDSAAKKPASRSRAKKSEENE